MTNLEIAEVLDEFLESEQIVDITLYKSDNNEYYIELYCLLADSHTIQAKGNNLADAAWKASEQYRALLIKDKN